LGIIALFRGIIGTGQFARELEIGIIGKFKGILNQALHNGRYVLDCEQPPERRIAVELVKAALAQGWETW
jgi:hypothetical protein